MKPNLHQKYRDLASAAFNPKMINDPEDPTALYAACKRIMHENGMMCPDDPEDPAFRDHLPVTEEHPVMAFIERAQELCEIAEKGYVYRRVDGDYIAETMDNTTAACFQRELAEPALSEDLPDPY